MSRNRPEKPGNQAPAKPTREQRLAEALRANLKRRKAAGREAPRDQPAGGEPDGD